jgi:NAD(P)-dependent dehydrogenase (short-subunit alcohol dehydrogenase family)
MAKHFAKALDGKTGSLISISSGNGIFTSPAQSSYCANKVAALRIIEQLHIEVPNIRAFNVHPGVVETQMVADAAANVGMKMNVAWTTPDLTGAVSLFLTTTRAEFLRGRFVSVNWRMDELEAMRDDIVKHHLLKTAFNGKMGL